jgi:hypothetical protein
MLTVLPRNPGSSGLSACLLVRGSRCLVGSTLPEPNKQVATGRNDDVCEFPENRPSNPEYRDVKTLPYKKIVVQANILTWCGGCCVWRRLCMLSSAR